MFRNMWINAVLGRWPARLEPRRITLMACALASGARDDGRCPDDIGELSQLAGVDADTTRTALEDTIKEGWLKRTVQGLELTLPPPCA